MALSLEKKTELVRIQLEKNNIPTDLVMQVKMIMDVSYSFKWAFLDGTINELVNRLIPLGMRFDDNGSLECYAFGSRATKVSDITVKDFDSYIDKKFLKDARDVLWGGTEYATALRLLMEDIKPSAPKSFLGKLFSSKKVEQNSDVPNFVMFITDGDSNDESETERLLAQLADTKTYVQLIGVGRGFSFLKRMADKFDHVGFVNFTDISNTGDEEMYKQLLGAELCTWIKAQ